jgi:hypothetical protein
MPAYDPWRDSDGHPIPPLCRIEQVAVGKNYGALPSRLRMRGQGIVNLTEVRCVWAM